MNGLPLVEALVRVTWLFASALLLLTMTRRASASFRHLICILSVAAATTLPLAMMWSPRVEVAPWAGTLLGAEEESFARPSRREVQAPIEVDSSVLAPSVSLGPVTEAAADAPQRTPVTVEPGFDWRTTFGVVWLAGSLGLLLQTLTGFVLVRVRFGRAAGDLLCSEIRESCSVPKDVVVRVVPRALQPRSVGVWNPHVVVPTAFLSWASDRQRAVLLHEVAHVRRRDGLSLVLWHAARALWWPHPLLWWCGKVLAATRERACDDSVLQNGFSPVSYAHHLVEIARSIRFDTNSPARSSLAMISRSDLERRVHALLAPRLSRKRPGTLVRTLAVLATVVSTLAVGAGQSSRAQVQDPVVQEEARLPPPRLGDPAVIQLALTESGKVVYAGQEIGIDGVRPLVERLCKFDQRPVILQSANDASSGLLVRVIDEAKKGGAGQIAITTPAHAASLSKPVASGVIHLGLTKDGKVVYAGRSIAIDGVRPLVELLLEGGDYPVVLHSASDAPAALLVRVIDLAKSAGAHRVSVTTPESAGASIPVTTPVEHAGSSDLEIVALSSRWSGRGDVTEGDAVPIEALDAAPRIVHRELPKVPAELRAHVPAKVVLLCVVNERGEVAAARVRESSDPRFNSSAMHAVGRWRFAPGTRRGEPVAFRVRVPLRFPGEGPLAEGPTEETEPAPKVVAPKPTTRVPPVVPVGLRTHTPATVVLAVVVDQEGNVVTAVVSESSDARFDRAAIEAVEKWRFEPGTRDGETVLMETRITVTFPDH